MIDGVREERVQVRSNGTSEGDHRAHVIVDLSGAV